MFEKFENENGFVIMDGKRLVIKFFFGSRGGAWTASGYFNQAYKVVKNNGKELDESPRFGTKNGGYYIPIVDDAYIVNGKLFVRITRKTQRWYKTYEWQVEKV